MQYILTGKTTEIKVVFTYDLRGFIQDIHIEGAESEKQLYALFWNEKFPFPFVERIIPEVAKMGFFNIEKGEDDLSFDRFWEEYNYKVSKKKAEKLYAKISRANRVKIFLHLPKYEAYLKARKGIEKAYPDTYLRNEKWNDEY